MKNREKYRDEIVKAIKDGVFSNTKPVGCPLKKEVNHGSN